MIPKTKLSPSKSSSCTKFWGRWSRAAPSNLAHSICRTKSTRWASMSCESFHRCRRVRVFHRPATRCFHASTQITASCQHSRCQLKSNLNLKRNAHQYPAPLESIARISQREWTRRSKTRAQRSCQGGSNHKSSHVRPGSSKSTRWPWARSPRCME